jgi:hypothetical protein
MHGTFASSMKQPDETRRSSSQESKAKSTMHDGLVARVNRHDTLRAGRKRRRNCGRQPQRTRDDVEVDGFLPVYRER